MKANCVVCGAEFEKRGASITCSETCCAIRRKQIKGECSRRHDERKKQGVDSIAQCAVCGMSYRKLKSAKTCSDGCRTAYYAAKQRIYKSKTYVGKGPMVWEETCVVCGALFTNEAAHNKKACSRDCRAARKLQMNKAWNEANPESLQKSWQKSMARGRAAKALGVPLFMYDVLQVLSRSQEACAS